jgi:hypothetical protein
MMSLVFRPPIENQAAQNLLKDVAATSRLGDRPLFVK